VAYKFGHKFVHNVSYTFALNSGTLPFLVRLHL
jgi:hypothetical protein